MAKQKFFTPQVKIGIAFISAVAILFFGINFLKGVNIFTPQNHYILRYENLDGLVISNGVFIQGYKIGQVREIKYDFTQSTPFTVEIQINKDIKLPQGTVAYLFDESLLGGKGINLALGDSRDSFHTSGDTLTTDVQGGLLASVGDIVPTIQTTIQHADSLIVSANMLVNSQELQNSLKNIEKITAELSTTSAGLRKLIDQKFPPVIDNVNAVVVDLKDVAAGLKTINYNDLGEKLDSTMLNIQQLSQRVNDPNGTLGKLINDPTMYNNLNTTISSANNLLIDIKANPKRYINITVFGGKKDK